MLLSPKVTAIVIGGLSQLVLGTLPAQNHPGYTGYMTYTNGLISGMYRANGGLSDEEWVRLALDASTDAITIAMKNNLATPKGVTILLTAENPADLYISTIGAGTSNHGEENMRELLRGSLIQETKKADVVTYDRTKGGDGWMAPCPGRCDKLVAALEWKDIHESVRKTWVAMGRPQPKNSPPPSPKSPRGVEDAGGVARQFKA